MLFLFKLTILFPHFQDHRKVTITINHDQRFFSKEVYSILHFIDTILTNVDSSIEVKWNDVDSEPCN